MNAAICAGAFALGLVIVAWVGAGYFAASALALAITALIGAAYLAGGLELLRFRRDSRALEAALGAPPVDDAALDPWLARLPASLRQPVRLRIEGERLALPGPVLTPYLVGLLVLLGMLGTFLGLVLTLDGTVAALEGMTDLDAVRSALASPVKGLAFAFGTSVAGVAASAMLGLVSTLCRRERLRVGQLLDAQIGAALRRFSRAHQREQALDALRAQAVAMPALIDAVSAAMAQVQAREAEAAERHRQFLDQTREQQVRLVDELRDGHAQLAGSVASALSDSLARSARLAGTEIRSGVESAMAAIAAESQAMQRQVAASMAQQLDALNAGFEQRSAALHDRIDRQLATALGQLSARIDGTAERLLADLGAGAAGIQASAAASEEARQAALVATLSGIAASLREDWRALAERSQAEAARTIGEVGRLMAVAAQAPEAAAEVVGRIREQLSDSLARDNAALEERAGLMNSLRALAASLTDSAVEQRRAIDELAAASHAALERAGEGFERQVGLFAGRLDEFAAKLDVRTAQIVGAAHDVAGGSAEVASLGETFGHAVALFAESNAQLTESLQRIEGALEKTAARSDEQLAYYVAQARELIELSVEAQRQASPE